MFIKNSVFKKIIKGAWSGAGLTVGNVHGRYVVITDIMIMYVKHNCITKEVKAAIIELAGDLPGEGEVFTAYKDGENQQAMTIDEILNGEMYESPSFSEEWIETSLLTTTGHRIMQEKSGLNKCMIPEIVKDLIKPSEREEGESWPEGPISAVSGSTMVWRNETTVINSQKINATGNSLATIVLKLLQPCDWRVESERV